MGDPRSDHLLDSNGVCAEVGGKSKMTIWRWQRDPRVNFPKPDIIINGRNYWHRSTIKRWQATLSRTTSEHTAEHYASAAI